MAKNMSAVATIWRDLFLASNDWKFRQCPDLLDDLIEKR
jgi:hypothetical protein